MQGTSLDTLGLVSRLQWNAHHLASKFWEIVRETLTKEASSIPICILKQGYLNQNRQIHGKSQETQPSRKSRVSKLITNKKVSRNNSLLQSQLRLILLQIKPHPHPIPDFLAPAFGHILVYI